MLIPQKDGFRLRPGNLSFHIIMIIIIEYHRNYYVLILILPLFGLDIMAYVYSLDRPSERYIFIRPRALCVDIHQRMRDLLGNEDKVIHLCI